MVFALCSLRETLEKARVGDTNRNKPCPLVQFNLLVVWRKRVVE
jgi:hypothetical protein